MINLKETTKILNSGDIKYSQEEIIAIRDFLYSLAQIEYENYVNNIPNIDNSQ